jgi:SSS family solute:Na+ symporter
MEKEFKIKDLNIIEMKPWKHAKAMSIALCIITVLIYILLGTN